MIVVKIELHSARTHEVTEIGRMHIMNTGYSDRPEWGNYVARLFRRGSRKVLREASVNDHARLSATVWKLVAKAIKETRA